MQQENASDTCNTKVTRLPHILSVQVSSKHSFSKTPTDTIQLVQNFGVQDDAHGGEHDQHLYHIKKFGQQPNLRQVHLIHAEFFDEVARYGYDIQAGDLGENIATRNIDLLNLPTNTCLKLGPQARIKLTGLRNPCHQIDDFRTGLLKHCVDKLPTGIVRKLGVMSIVETGGTVKPNDAIEIVLPPEPYKPLEYIADSLTWQN